MLQCLMMSAYLFEVHLELAVLLAEAVEGVLGLFHLALLEREVLLHGREPRRRGEVPRLRQQPAHLLGHLLDLEIV